MMSIAIVHFAFGAGMTTLLVTFLFADAPSPVTVVTAGDWLERLPTVPYPRTVILLGGVWAVLPDVQRITPINRSWFFDLHKSYWADIFWFHRTIDVLDPNDSEMIAAVLVLFFIGVTVLAEWWEYRVGDCTSETPGDEPIDNSE